MLTKYLYVFFISMGPLVELRGAIPIGTVGLGLPMVRTIVQAHGGRVWAESRPGGGSVFLFRLPAL